MRSNKRDEGSRLRACDALVFLCGEMLGGMVDDWMSKLTTKSHADRHAAVRLV